MRHYSRTPYVGPNLLCMAIGAGVMLATSNPIAGLIAYIVPLFIFVQIAKNRK